MEVAEKCGENWAFAQNNMLIYLQEIESERNKSKFEQIYLQYRLLMFVVANRILHNDADAEDTVHQAFIRIAENIEKFSAPICPKTQSYIVTIVEHLAIDLYRKNRRNPVVEFEDSTLHLTLPPMEEGSLAAAILQLPPRDRAVLLLRYDNGYSNKEVAHMLGLSMDATRKAEQRAKVRLKELLKKEGTLL